MVACEVSCVGCRQVCVWESTRACRTSVKTNVSKRIEFIKNDIGRLESSVKAKEKEQEEVRSQIAKLQKQQAEATGGQ